MNTSDISIPSPVLMLSLSVGLRLAIWTWSDIEHWVEKYTMLFIHVIYFFHSSPMFSAAEDDDFVVWNMLSEKDNPSRADDSDEEDDYFMEYCWVSISFSICKNHLKSASFNAVNHIILQCFIFYLASGCFLSAFCFGRYQGSCLLALHRLQNKTILKEKEKCFVFGQFRVYQWIVYF